METGTWVCLGRFGEPIGRGGHRVRPPVCFFLLFLYELGAVMVAKWQIKRGTAAVAAKPLPRPFSAQRTATAWQPS